MGDNEDESAKAYKAIAAQLKTWTSPKKLSSVMMDIDEDDSDYEYSYENTKRSRSSMGNHEIDTLELMQRELKQDQPTPQQLPPRSRPGGTSTLTGGVYSSTPKRSPLLERASTPVMSNSSTSKRKKNKPTPNVTPVHGKTVGYDVEMEQPPAPVETPALRISKPAISASKVGIGGINRMDISSPMMASTEREERGMQNYSTTFLLESPSHYYRRYHDALLSFLKARRSISGRLELEKQELALIQQQLPDEERGAIENYTTPFALPDQEQQAEVDFLRSLNLVAWNGAAASSSEMEAQWRRREGNLWKLLQMLRKLGLAALIWASDPSSNTQNVNSQIVYLQQLAAQIDLTPKELIEALSSSSRLSSEENGRRLPVPPLLIQRRYQILKWMERCHDDVRKEPPKPSKTFGATSKANIKHPDDAAPPLIGESNRAEEEFLESCLSHLLAGKLDQSLAIARTHDQPWRAATWSGGAPAGFESRPNDQTKTMDRIPVGNPSRFLWKRQMWNAGQALVAKSPAAAAISSTLANDVESSLVNPCLRTWEKGLYVTLFSMWGRMEDQLLHWHNNNRRKSSSSNGREWSYPGTRHTRQEQEQLLVTHELAGMTEKDVVKMLFASPFQEMRGLGCYEAAAAAFVVGSEEIVKFCDAETNAQVQDFQKGSASSYYDDDDDDDTTTQEEREEGLYRLRFLTHLTLYLDSLSASTTPVVLSGIQDQKNELLFQYVRYLASRHDMLHMVTLYASLLPAETLLGYYPTVLSQVTDDDERKAMLDQMRELLQPSGAELPILRRVVRLLLSASSEEEDDNVSDVEKCRAIQWLLHYEEHLGDALICANMLLRSFFLSQEDDKMATAISLVEEYLPHDFLDSAGIVVPPEENPDVYQDDINQARLEHIAFLSYLQAYRVFGEWKETLFKAEHSFTSAVGDGSACDFGGDRGTIESTIAQQRVLREWIRRKNENSESVIGAANVARKALQNVLTHPGSWLWIDDNEYGDELARPSANLDAIHEGDIERRRRLQEISVIRGRYVVLAVNLYHQVCEETATWMSRSLDDDHGIPMVVPEGASRRRLALQTLAGKQSIDELASSIGLAASPLSPSYWYQQALDLAELVANDTHGIHKAFGQLELREFLSKLGETAVSNLMDSV